MAAPVYSTGQVLSASDCNNWFTGEYAYKTSDTSRASNTTLSADPDLQFAVAANAKYYFSGTFYYTGGTQGSSDFKMGWTFPAGLTMVYAKTGLDTTGAVAVGLVSLQTDTPTFGTAVTLGNRTIQLSGTIFVSSTAGTLALQWCQGTSNTTATVLKAGSGLILVRVG